MNLLKGTDDHTAGQIINTPEVAGIVKEVLHDRYREFAKGVDLEFVGIFNTRPKESHAEYEARLDEIESHLWPEAREIMQMSRMMGDNDKMLAPLTWDGCWGCKGAMHRKEHCANTRQTLQAYFQHKKQTGEERTCGKCGGKGHLLTDCTMKFQGEVETTEVATED